MKLRNLFPLLIFLLFLGNFTNAQTETCYEITLDGLGEELSLERIDLNTCDWEESSQVGNYFAKIYGENKSLIDIFFFNIQEEFIYDFVDPETGEIYGGYIEQPEQVSTELIHPYYENAREIIIYDSNLNELLVIDVSLFAKDIDQGPMIGEEAAEDEEVGEDLEKDSPETIGGGETEKDLKDYWPVLLIILIILVFILFYSLKKKN